MLVIMDMEWFESKSRYFCPTQISAIRIDRFWHIIDRFDNLIKPYDKTCQKWNHVSYSGSEPRAFLAADSGPVVLMNLFKWLRNDDVLCWWGEQPALVFQLVVNRLLRRELKHEMRTIYPAWSRRITDGLSLKGSPYKMAKERGITVPVIEHCSKNDVDVILSLMEDTPIAQSDILTSTIDQNAKIHIYNKTIDKEKTGKHEKEHPYYCDMDKKVVHILGCPIIQSADNLRGVDTLKNCIKHRFQPCNCCRDDYWTTNGETSSNIIANCHFVFVYDANGRLFHKPNCLHVKRIPYYVLRGSGYYSNCLDRGLKPCGWCKPKAKDEESTFHIYNFSKVSRTKKDLSDLWVTTRRLTVSEQAAYRRYTVAVKDRANLISNAKSMTIEERQDAFTLSQSGYAFWAAVGYGTFHRRGCKKLVHLSGLRGYACFADAIRSGLTPCKKCKPSPKAEIKASIPIYSKLRTGETVGHLDELCDHYGYFHRFESPDYYIETPVGKWRLNTKTNPIDVYHINLTNTLEKELYHKQPRLFLSLRDTFEYIHRHDSTLMKGTR